MGCLKLLSPTSAPPVPTGIAGPAAATTVTGMTAHSHPCSWSVNTATGKVSTATSVVTAILPDGSTRVITRKEQLARYEALNGRLRLRVAGPDGTATVTISRQCHNSSLPPAPAGSGGLAWARFGTAGTAAAGALAAAGVHPELATSVLGSVVTCADPGAAAALVAAVLAQAPAGADRTWADAISRGGALAGHLASSEVAALSASASGALSQLRPGAVSTAVLLLDVLAVAGRPTTPAALSGAGAALVASMAAAGQLSAADELSAAGVDIATLSTEAASLFTAHTRLVPNAADRAGTWWQLGLVDEVYDVPRTSTGFKLHIGADTPEQVAELAARLLPVVCANSLDVKFAGGQLLYSGDPEQSRKGAVVYLPRRETMAADTAAVLAAVAGSGAAGTIPGDVALAPGVGLRNELMADLGRDLNPGEAKALYSVAGAAMRSPDHEAARAALVAALAGTSEPVADLLFRVRAPFKDSGGGLPDSACVARQLTAAVLTSASAHGDPQRAELAKLAGAMARTVPASDPAAVADAVLAWHHANPDVPLVAARTVGELAARSAVRSQLEKDTWSATAATAPWGPQWSSLQAATEAESRLGAAAAHFALATAPDAPAYVSLLEAGAPIDMLVNARSAGVPAFAVRASDTRAFTGYARAALAPTGLPPDVVEHYATSATGWSSGQSFELLTRVWPDLGAGPIAGLGSDARDAVVDASLAAFRAGVGPVRLADQLRETLALAASGH